MSEHSTLSSEELSFIREVFSSQLIGKALPIPAFKVDGGPLANALLARLGGHARLSLEATLDDCRMTFPLQLVEDELHGLQLEMGAPSIFEDGRLEDGAIRRPWRLELDEPLGLRDRKGNESGLLIYELAPSSVVLVSPSMRVSSSRWRRVAAFIAIAPSLASMAIAVRCGRRCFWVSST